MNFGLGIFYCDNVALDHGSQIKALIYHRYLSINKAEFELVFLGYV